MSGSRSTIHTTRTGLLALLVALASLPGAAARASGVPLKLFYDSTTPSTSDPPPTAASVNVNSSWAGKFFFPVITEGYQLAAVKVLLQGVPTGSVSLSIWSDGGSVPGTTQIATLSPSGPLVSGTNTFTSTAILPPNLSYWVVMQDPTGTALWRRTDAPVTGAGAATSTARYFNSGSGFSWQPQSDGAPLMMQIYAVPEPSTYWMGAAGLSFSCVMGLRRRRRSAGRGGASMHRPHTPPQPDERSTRPSDPGFRGGVPPTEAPADLR
jgi:hypothetical protein